MRHHPLRMIKAKTSAFDYNSDEDILVINNDQSASRRKRKRESSKDEETTCSQYKVSKHKMLQPAIHAIKKPDNNKKKNAKKSKEEMAQSTCSSSSDEQDFDKPAKKSSYLVKPKVDPDQLAPPKIQVRNAKTLLNLKKNKLKVVVEDLLNKKNNSNADSAYESIHVDLKSVEGLTDIDGDDHDKKDDGGKVQNQKAEYRNEILKGTEKNPDHIEKLNCVEETRSEIVCPMCSRVFDDSVEQAIIDQHVNSCLDGKATLTTEVQIPDNNPKSSLSILKDQLLAFEYQRKEIQECEDVFGNGNGFYFCQICQKDLSKMNSQRRQQHINKCCDQTGKEKEEIAHQMKSDYKKVMLNCPFCNMAFKSRKSWKPHIKRCAQKNSVPANQLLEIVKQQDLQLKEIETTSKLTEDKTEDKTETKVNQDNKKKSGQVRKKRKIAQNLRNVDDETQLAMALSASMAPAPPGNDNLTRKPKRKRINNEVIPALLLRSKEETQNIIAARAAQVVCNKDDSEEEDITCTPALAPSSLAERFLKVEKANAKVVMKKSTVQVIEKTKDTITDMLDQDGELLVEKQSSSTQDMSVKPIPARQEDTGVISLSDMLASPDMCRSFLSFLDVDNETASKEANVSSIKDSSTNVKPSQPAPLWCMASLIDKESSISDFYVPGLLPIPLPKQIKRTPRKSSSTTEQKLSRSIYTERIKQSKVDLKKSEEICEDNVEESLVKPTKMSDSELASASQAANLDILLELVHDVDEDNDDDESLKTPRKSSVDCDGEVFPSSGFCLPVDTVSHINEENRSVSSSLTAFLQDMSKMVGNRLLSDVMIVTKGDKNIPAHSFMLATRSEYLAKMISDTRLSTDGHRSGDKPVCLFFNDVEADTVCCILQYIYTGSVNVPQSLKDDLIILANRLKLFELVKACQDCYPIVEKQQSKTGDKVPEEDGGQSVRGLLSAEELLDTIWQGHTGDFESKQSNEEQSQEEQNEGFNDDDIEEVRIFQTQAVCKRRCSEDNLGSWQGILGLENKSDTEKNLKEINKKKTEAENPAGELLEIIEGASEGKEPNFNEKVEAEKNKNTKELSIILDAGEIQLQGVRFRGSLEEKNTENWEARKKEIIEGKPKQFLGKGDGDCFNWKETCTGNRNELEKCDIYEDECELAKCDTDNDGKFSDGKPDACTFFESSFDCDVESKLDADEGDKIKEKKKFLSSDIQLTDLSSEVHSCFDPNRETDDNHTNEYANVLRSGYDDNIMCYQASDPTFDPIGNNSDDNVDQSDSEAELEHQKYKSIEEDSEPDVDIGILNESITLLSDDNDSLSPEGIMDKKLIIPETPHPKHKDKREISLGDSNTKQPSESCQHSSSLPVQHVCVSNEVSNELKEKDHISEDEEAFRDKLKSRIKAKNQGKKKLKGKGKEKQTKICSRNKRPLKETPMELDCRSTSKGYKNSCSSTSSNDADVVDFSFENEIENLMNESVSTYFEATENQVVHFKGNTSEKKTLTSDNTEERSFSSLSLPKILSPKAPSSCSLDFDHEVPSPCSSPVHSVHSDVSILESVSYTCVNRSPEGMPINPGSSAEFHGEIKSKFEEHLQEVTGGPVASDSTLQRVHLAVDSEHESENSDNVALIPVTASEADSTSGPFNLNVKSSLFKRLGASKYGIKSTEIEVLSDVESDCSGLDTPRQCQWESQELKNKNSMAATSLCIPEENDFQEDGGFNCDMDNLEACLGGDDSFMEHVAEQLKPECQVQESELGVPVSRTPTHFKVQDGSVTTPITPMPDYDAMDTPDLKIEVNKFGVRALPKKKMKAKLIEIYQYTHPGALTQKNSKENPKETTSRTTKDSSLKLKGPQTAKPPSRTTGASSPRTKQAKKKKGPASEARESSDSDDNGYSSFRPSPQRCASLKPSSYNTKKDTQKQTTAILEDGSLSSCCSSKPVLTPPRNIIESTTSSKSDEEKSAGLGSADSQNEDEEEFGEVSILIDNEAVMSSQQVDSDNLESKLLSYIENSKDIYLKVLNYQPIDLMALHELIKSDGIKCRIGQLVDFLDSQCITFTTAGQKPRQRRKPPRKKK